MVLALSLSAYYAYKTRSKILRHGKANIFWDEPRVRASEGQDAQSWVSNEVISSWCFNPQCVKIGLCSDYSQISQSDLIFKLALVLATNGCTLIGLITRCCWLEVCCGFRHTQVSLWLIINQTSDNRCTQTLWSRWQTAVYDFLGEEGSENSFTPDISWDSSGLSVSIGLHTSYRCKVCKL